MSAILFGSISTVADTSELQRKAFNQAFEAHGLEWSWSREDYRAMLGTSGGEARIATYAEAHGAAVDAAAVHASKSELFQASLRQSALSPRPGVIDIIDVANKHGWRLGLVTTTSAANVAALLEALSPTVRRETFDVIIDSSAVDRPKPDGAAYLLALQRLLESPENCLAIEDNVDGVASAVAAGVPCLAFPNENTEAGDFSAAEDRVDQLDPTTLSHLLVGA